jgi:hypothetical protein
MAPSFAFFAWTFAGICLFGVAVNLIRLRWPAALTTRRPRNI